MLVKGRRVLLTKPIVQESEIVLDEKSKAAVEKELMKKWTALEVSHVGENVTQVKPGDRVYVATYHLEHSEVIDIEGSIKLMVAEDDIAIVW